METFIFVFLKGLNFNDAGEEQKKIEKADEIETLDEKTIGNIIGLLGTVCISFLSSFIIKFIMQINTSFFNSLNNPFYPEMIILVITFIIAIYIMNPLGDFISNIINFRAINKKRWEMF